MFHKEIILELEHVFDVDDEQVNSCLMHHLSSYFILWFRVTCATLYKEIVGLCEVNLIDTSRKEDSMKL